MAARSAFIGVAVAIVVAAPESAFLLAAIDAVFCRMSFSDSLLNYFAPPKPMISAFAMSPVLSVSAVALGPTKSNVVSGARDPRNLR